MKDIGENKKVGQLTHQRIHNTKCVDVESHAFGGQALQSISAMLNGFQLRMPSTRDRLAPQPVCRMSGQVGEASLGSHLSLVELLRILPVY